MIRISGLVHRFREYPSDGGEAVWKTALNGVSLNVEDGQFVVILGPNGSGKSTLARHLNVLLKPDEGTVWIDGLNAEVEQELWKIRDSVGMVFQNPDNQIIGTTVDEDCAFGLEVRGMEPVRIRKREEESLTTVNLLDKRDCSPTRLSGGEKQRLAIAGVVACRPRCIVLDEPTAMLDPRARAEVLDLLHGLNRENRITVILITHHMDEAVDAHRILIMDQGRIAMEGTPQAVFADLNRLRSLHLEVPQVTAVADRLHELGFDFTTPILTKSQFVTEFLRLSGKQTEVTYHDAP